jgi:Uma2 family endonuclease
MSIADIPTPVQVGPESNGMLMTPEEFDALEDWEEGYRYELVHGVLIVTPPPALGEHKPNDELGHWLLTYRDTHPHGSALDDTAPEHTIQNRTGRRRTDRAVWAGLGRTPDYDHDPPAIAIEFVGRRSRDRRRDYFDKRQEYTEAGVREYWIIDRFRRTMTVCRGVDEEEIVVEGQSNSTKLLPGFELPFARLLAIADRTEGQSAN